ncbi:MAG: tetratricopeptide repeat protein [Pseudomonadota bacterium]
MQHHAFRPALAFIKRACALAVLSLACAGAQADEAADVQKLMAAGKASEALQKADQYLASKPRDPMMRFLRGIALSQMNRTAEAITAFTKLTEDYPELPEPFNNLAVLYAQQGQYDKARTALEMAIRTNPSYATAYENLGDVYAKLASQAYSKALQIDTRSAVAPKLAMIRELFPKDRGTAVAAAATPVPAATPPAGGRPAAAPVAPSAPPAAAPAAKPAPSPAPAPAATDGASRDVEAAVRSWAQAWSRKDLDDYFAAYTPDFSGGKSRRAWEQERRARITGKKKIAVRVSDLVVNVQGDRATARFRQDYEADGLDISSRKTLHLVRRGNAWLIEKESVGS